MKKITALIMMALLITIGGVYASWVYSDGVTGETNHFIKDKANIHMDAVDNSNAKGVIAVDYSNAKFVIADDGDGNEGSVGYGDHVAELDVSGAINFTFTANKGSAVSEIEVQYKVAISDTTVTWADRSSSEQRQIFTVASSDWVDLGLVGTSGVSVNAADLGLSLGGEFYLPTYKDFTDFQTKLNSFSIIITVREKPSV